MTWLTLILPAYNGAAFLEASLRKAYDWLANQERDTELLVIDDGSSDTTPEILASFESRARGRPVFRWLRNDPNQGKGFAVRRAMLEARGDYRVFADSDLTYPIDNVGRIVAALEAGAEVAIASRTHRDSLYVVAPSFFRYLYTRHLLGRFFNLLVRLFIVGGVHDTQAGLKGATRRAAFDLFPRCRLTRFSFDVELLFLARRLGKRIEEVGVTFLYRKEPTTVRFVRDTFRMLFDMARIRWRAFRGRYDRPTPPEAILAHPACVSQSSE